MLVIAVLSGLGFAASFLINGPTITQQLYGLAQAGFCAIVFMLALLGMREASGASAQPQASGQESRAVTGGAAAFVPTGALGRVPARLDGDILTVLMPGGLVAYPSRQIGEQSLGVAYAAFPAPPSPQDLARAAVYAEDWPRGERRVTWLADVSGRLDIYQKAPTRVEWIGRYVVPGCFLGLVLEGRRIAAQLKGDTIGYLPEGLHWLEAALRRGEKPSVTVTDISDDTTAPGRPFVAVSIERVA
jgi:hypothetical protein